PPWTGAEIVGVIFLAALGQVVAQSWLDGAGWWRWYYGDAGVSKDLKTLWTLALGYPLQIALTLTWLRFASGITMAELGLTAARWGRNVAAGLLFALIFAPGTYGINAM